MTRKPQPYRSPAQLRRVVLSLSLSLSLLACGDSDDTDDSSGQSDTGITVFDASGGVVDVGPDLVEEEVGLPEDTAEDTFLQEDVATEDTSIGEDAPADGTIGDDAGDASSDPTADMGAADTADAASDMMTEPELPPGPGPVTVLLSYGNGPPTGSFAIFHDVDGSVLASGLFVIGDDEVGTATYDEMPPGGMITVGTNLVESPFIDAGPPHRLRTITGVVPDTTYEYVAPYYPFGRVIDPVAGSLSLDLELPIPAGAVRFETDIGCYSAFSSRQSFEGSPPYSQTVYESCARGRSTYDLVLWAFNAEDQVIAYAISTEHTFVPDGSEAVIDTIPTGDWVEWTDDPPTVSTRLEDASEAVEADLTFGYVHDGRTYYPPTSVDGAVITASGTAAFAWYVPTGFADAVETGVDIVFGTNDAPTRDHLVTITAVGPVEDAIFDLATELSPSIDEGEASYTHADRQFAVSLSPSVVYAIDALLVSFSWREDLNNYGSWSILLPDWATVLTPDLPPEGIEEGMLAGISAWLPPGDRTPDVGFGTWRVDVVDYESLFDIWGGRTRPVAIEEVMAASESYVITNLSVTR